MKQESNNVAERENTQQEFLAERLELSMERIWEMPREHWAEGEAEPFEQYFASVAEFVALVEENRCFMENGGLQNASLEELQKRNHALYADILEENYENSYANPVYAVNTLGEEFGALLSFLYSEMRSVIGFSYEGRISEMVIRMELFLEVYAVFVYEWEENKSLPIYDNIRKIIYWFASDYADISAEQRVKELVVPLSGENGNNFAADIIMNADLSDVRYLFAYGEYVGENELAMARFMAELPQETINTMADTYTEGYCIGFVVGNKDLSKKKTVELRYPMGFERMMRRAVENFAKLGLAPVIYRAPASVMYNRSIVKNGFFGTVPNRQYDFDHKDDKALFLDKTYCNRKVEVMHTAFEKYREEARVYAGPAVVETFGEKDFNPVNKPERIKLTEEQNALWVEHISQSGELQRKYILPEERSFTIIAFPIPEIGDCFPELFKEIIRINTLDYKLYQQIQQCIIDALDKAEYCEIKGMDGNRTDLRISLKTLANPEKETIFENCVADVNIPVGEVFTSPMLKGTNGILHVSKVFLNGLEYKNLAITFEDGMIHDYTCDNFAKEEDNQAFIRENVLYRHKTLPMGEFAIGTNTTAYVAAKKFGVEDKFPILIAEKMGPHFAVGDTCYSHAEEVKVFNPDGKEIVAKDNEVSLLRSTNPAKAYFNCHTDITIPYDELGELNAVQPDGTCIAIIREGRFVLPGTEALNEAFV